MEKTKEKKLPPVHFNEMLHMLATAEERRQLVDVRAWRSDGGINHYKGWLVHHDHWTGGYVRLRSPRSKQIRLVPQIFIFEINKHQVYL